MNTASTNPPRKVELPALVVPLLKGVIYREGDPALWNGLLALAPRVRDYVAVLGLDLVLDEAEGYAFSTRSSIWDFCGDYALSGFRLHRLEVFNWGTFHKRVWQLNLAGANSLLTGDIGSGKSTLVDAMTTLLVPAQRIAYNKAAVADANEGSLRSYVLGHYISERNDITGNAKPVALRDNNDYSVILGVFHNTGYDQTITLAQVFQMKEAQGQPARFFVGAERALSIGTDFVTPKPSKN